MNDRDLRELLNETWPIRPGQESRAWNAWQSVSIPRATRLAPLWRGALAAGGVVAGVALFLTLWPASSSVAPVSAASQSPEIFATAFYSKPAQAQVVWLNGMDPATDGPTYMDPSTRVDGDPASPQAPAQSGDQL